MTVQDVAVGPGCSGSGTIGHSVPDHRVASFVNWCFTKKRTNQVALHIYDIDGDHIGRGQRKGNRGVIDRWIRIDMLVEVVRVPQDRNSG